jgi:hypothetical protein
MRVSARAAAQKVVKMRPAASRSALVPVTAASAWPLAIALHHPAGMGEGVATASVSSTKRGVVPFRQWPRAA